MDVAYVVLALLVAVMGGGCVGFGLGADHETATKAREDRHITEAVKAATDASAQAIAKLRPTYTTIQNKLEHEIRTNTVFADCKLPPVGLQLVNQALAPGSVAPGGGELPGVDAVGR